MKPEWNPRRANAIEALRLVAAVLALTAGGCLGAAPEQTVGDGGSSDATVVEGSEPAMDAATPGTLFDATARADGGADDEGGANTNVPLTQSCLSGAACALGACDVGVTECDGGSPACVRKASVVNGTACDAGDDAAAVCSGGSCSACNLGADCTEAGSCQQLNVACSTGSPVCMANCNVIDGTKCGANLYCNKGACAPCTNGSSCAPAGKPCNRGSVTCAQGQATCNDLQMPAADGTACGTNEVCSGGQCVACTANDVCTPANACHTGLGSCATGTHQCVDMGQKPDGTGCTGTDKCMQSYTCKMGTCTGSNPVTCPASDQCHSANQCSSSTGACSSTPLTGTPCSDGNGCTQSDTCQSGTCMGSNPVVCPATACHVNPTCSSSGATTHTCTSQPGMDGSSCGTHMVCSGGNCGCATGYNPCNGACIDMTGANGDNGNCGACGHSCSPGLCTNSQCQPWIVANSSMVQNLSALASDGTTVVWSDLGNTSIMAVSALGGGTATNLKQDSSFGGAVLSVANGTAAWTNGTTIWTAAAAGGAQSGVQQSYALPSWNVIDVVLNSNASHIAVTLLDGGTSTQSLYDCTLGVGAACTSIGQVPTPSGLGSSLVSGAANSAGYFFVDLPDSAINLFPFGTVSFRTLVPSQGSSLTMFDVTLDPTNTNVYFMAADSSNNDHISRAPQGGGTVTAVTTFSGGAGAMLATDGKNVYFTYPSTNANQGFLGYAPAAGGSATYLRTASATNSTKSLVYAGGALFWADASASTIYGMRPLP